MSTDSKKMIVLKSSDGQTFEVEESVVVASETIKAMIEDGCADDTIPLPNVTANILVEVIKFLKHHHNGGEGGSDKKPSESEGGEEPTKPSSFDSEFVHVDKGTLYDLAFAANYLNISSMLNLVMQTFADKIKGKSPEEVRAFFNIKNDFSPEEEAQVREENKWAFE